jgi:hypothetical protein
VCHRHHLGPNHTRAGIPLCPGHVARDDRNYITTAGTDFAPVATNTKPELLLNPFSRARHIPIVRAGIVLDVILMMPTTRGELETTLA